jgi:hypothetical protein
MSGYVCIAMLEDPPYNIMLGSSLEDPDAWVKKYPLPMHLLLYRQDSHPDEFLEKLIKSLKLAKIPARLDIPFPCKPSVALNIAIDVLFATSKPDKTTQKETNSSQLSIECGLCGGAATLEWEGFSSITKLKCPSCRGIIYGYRGIARSQRSVWGTRITHEGRYTGGYSLWIRSFDMDKSERLIMLLKSIHKPEIKSKDSFFIVACKNNIRLYNKTIGEQYSIYNVRDKSINERKDDVVKEKERIKEYLTLLGVIKAAT